MSRLPIFVGIDPGTTSAYAIIDVKGDIVEVDSAKGMGLGEIINHVADRGLPIAVGTDKAKVPETISKFAANTGCRVVAPENDLKVEEKKQFAEGFVYSNSHEMDAIASAINAYKSFLPLITRIMKHIKDVSREQIADELLLRVIRDEMPIKDAVMLLERQKWENKRMRAAISDEAEATEKKDLDRKDFDILYDKYRRARRENFLLREQNMKILHRAEKLAKQLSDISLSRVRKKSTDARKIDALFRFKEDRLRELEKEHRMKEKEILELRQEIESANRFISKLNKSYLLKRLENLGIKEYERKKSPDISEGDIVLVGNINIYNEKVLGLIRDKVNILVYEDKPTRKTQDELNFILIPSGDMEIERFADYAAISREQLDRVVQKKNVLKRIVENYRESRR